MSSTSDKIPIKEWDNDVYHFSTSKEKLSSDKNVWFSPTENWDDTKSYVMYKLRYALSNKNDKKDVWFHQFTPIKPLKLIHISKDFTPSQFIDWLKTKGVKIEYIETYSFWDNYEAADKLCELLDYDGWYHQKDIVIDPNMVNLETRDEIMICNYEQKLKKQKQIKLEEYIKSISIQLAKNIDSENYQQINEDIQKDPMDILTFYMKMFKVYPYNKGGSKDNYKYKYIKYKRKYLEAKKRYSNKIIQ
jgi:hypothetical protein